MMLSYPSPPLCDGVVHLRAWSDRDLGCVAEASRDAVIPAGTSVPTAYSEVEGQAFVARQLSRLTNAEGIAQVIAEADSNRAVGQIVVMFRQPPAASNVAGLGYWIVESARRRGYATRAVRLVVPWAMSELRLGRLESLVEPTNRASCRILESTGFRREGVLRSYLGMGSDAVMYSVTSADLDSVVSG